LVSIVFQDFTHYAVTLKENITMGDNMRYDELKLRKIVSQIGLTDLVNKLNHAIETPLGKAREGGVDISGGEWQKIALSRLLYKCSEINILDEPTASLDPIAEGKVYELFGNINKDKFTLYITHRLGAAKIASEILVVNNGRIEERGSHDQLMADSEGLYKKMFENQQSWYS
jgi:ATP-binding cassette subfamily B protein